MYKKLLEVFKEPCKFRGRNWFDAYKPCIKKASAQDYLSSFEKTFENLNENGFSNSKSTVQVTQNLFPLNGTDRIASAIALGMDTMPVQTTYFRHAIRWDANFFIKKGLPPKYIDFVWARFFKHIDNKVESILSFLQHRKENVHAVVLFPSVQNRKIDGVKEIIRKDAQIVVERTFWLNKNASDMFVQQIYPKEAWVKTNISNGTLHRALGKTNKCTIFFKPFY